MSINLKPYFDAAQAASEEVQRVMSEMDTHFQSGTEEGKAKALEMRPALDAAQQAAKDANELYLSMRNGAHTADSAAKQFVPAGKPEPAASQATSMTRAAFNALDAAARMKFIREGGLLSD